MKTGKNWSVKKMAAVSIFAALSYAAFAFLQIKILLPGADATSIHLGNAVCVLAALLIGGLPGGLAGAIGMTLGDLFDPIYIVYAPKTFILKLCIGLIAGAVSEKIGHINESDDRKYILKWCLLACIASLGFNVIFDPLLGYFYKLLILGRPMAEISLVWNIGATLINAVVSTAVASAVYMAVRPSFERMGFIQKNSRTMLK